MHPRLKRGYYSQHAVETLQGLGQAEPGLTALALCCAVRCPPMTSTTASYAACWARSAFRAARRRMYPCASSRAVSWCAASWRGCCGGARTSWC